MAHHFVRSPLAALTTCLLASSPLAAQPSARASRPAPPRLAADASPHREGWVSRGEVHVHYLDWGGTGEPIVFLPGLGSSAHTYDAFAPRLRDGFRPVAITRRGFGQSGRPTTGYDTPSLAADVLAVLDSLKLTQVTLVGHSLGGAEATWLAVHHPKRVRRVVLLESYCYQCQQVAPSSAPPPPGRPAARPKASAADLRSASALRAFTKRIWGMDTPEAEILATHRVAADGRIGARNSAPTAMDQVQRLVTPSELRRLRQPVLLVLAIPQDRGDELRWVPRPTRNDSAWALWSLRMSQARQRAWAELFRRMQPSGALTWIPHGAHHVYLSHPTEAERALRAFLGTQTAKSVLGPRPSVAQYSPSS